MALAEAGAVVVVSDIDAGTAAETAALITKNGGKARGLGEEWNEATRSLCPLPAEAKAKAVSHFGDGAAVGWDMQAVENVLCGIHDCKSPEAVVASAMKLKDKNKQGKPITPWQPNPCCALEYAELYGR